MSRPAGVSREEVGAVFATLATTVHEQPGQSACTNETEQVLAAEVNPPPISGDQLEVIICCNCSVQGLFLFEIHKGKTHKK